MIEETNQAWEQELTERLQDTLLRRSEVLREEWKRLEQAVATARASLTAADATATNETSELVASVSELLKTNLSQAEARYEERLTLELEKARAEVSLSIRQTLESEFERKFAQAIAAQKEAETQIAQLQLQLTEAINTTAIPPAPALPDFTTFKAAVEDIDEKRTQSETLNALLRSATHFAPRIVFFVVKGNEAIGWKAAGFQNGLNEETVRSLTVSTQIPNLLTQALTTQTAAVALNPPIAEINKVLGNFADFAPRGAVAVPLVVRGKAAAVLYADSADSSDEAIQLEAIETLIHVASMGIELLPVRRNLEPVARVTASTQAQVAMAAPEAQAETAAGITEQKTEPVSFDSPSMPLSTKPAFAISQPLVSPAPIPESEAIAVETPVNTVNDTGPIVEPVTEKVGEQPPANTASFTDSQLAETPQAETVETEQPKSASIFEKVRVSFDENEAVKEAEAETTTATPAEEEIAPATPSVPSLPTNTLEAPTWMRRLESPEIAGGNSLTELPPARPMPSTPPPMQRPSLANWGTKEREVEPPAPAPVAPPPAPFQNEAPSFKVPDAVPNFSAPSEPPRYAAPSLSVSTAASETEVRAHNDARRFARLLISEIKLYNAAKVNEGRRNGDLYDRLRDEIDRSRKVYDKRVSPTVAGKFDYFYDELVQTLAEGDPSKLGESCPGPFVVTA